MLQLGHRSEEQRSSHYVLVGHAKDWRVVSPLIFDNVAVDIKGMASRCAPVPPPPGGLVSLLGLAQLSETHALFFEPGHQLT